MEFRNTMQVKPPMTMNMDILGLAQRRHAITQLPKEDEMLYLEIEDDYIEIVDKELTPFEAMCQQMLAAHEEMSGEKFRELMARQLALLGPAASIADLVHALTQNGVVQPRSVRVESLNEKINRFNRHNTQMETQQRQTLATRRCYPSYSMY